MDIEKMIEAIASAFKSDASELSALLKNADGNGFLPDAEAQKTLGDYFKERFSAAKTDMHNRAKREVETSVSKRIRAAGFTNPEGLQGDALFAAAIDHFSAQTGGEAATMTEAELAKMPAVKAIVQRAKADAEALNANLKTEVEAERTARNRDRAAAMVNAIVAEKKVALGEGDTRKARLDAIGKLIDFNRVRFGEDGQPVMVDDNGDTMTDGFGKPVTFESHVITKAGVFGFDTRDHGKGGANPPAGRTGEGSGSGSGATITFDGEAAYEKYMKTETDGVRRKEATAAWYAQSAKKE